MSWTKSFDQTIGVFARNVGSEKNVCQGLTFSVMKDDQGLGIEGFQTPKGNRCWISC